MIKKRPFLIYIIILTAYSFLILTSINSNKKIYAVESYNNYVIQNSIISANKLHKIIYNQDVKVVYIKKNNEVSQYIPNTVIIDYEDIIKTINGVPGMITSKDQIDKIMSNLGISNDDTIIIYDKINSPYATRLFWTLKVYGHEYVKILNGGLDAWERQGFKTEKPLNNVKHSVYISNQKNVNMIATLENIKEALNNGDEIIIDVRSTEEYIKGHIPTAISVPFNLALRNDGLFKTYQDLQKIYEPLGIKKDKTIIYIYCSLGNRGSFTYYVLHELMGYNNVMLYDGSYSEYVKSGLPIE